MGVHAQAEPTASLGTTGGVEYTANASPRVGTIGRSSGGVGGNDRRNATKRSLAEGKEQRVRSASAGRRVRQERTAGERPRACEGDHVLASKYPRDRKMVRVNIRLLRIAWGAEREALYAPRSTLHALVCGDSLGDARLGSGRIDDRCNLEDPIGGEAPLSCVLSRSMRCS